MAQTTVHEGSYESIPATSSPGLLFLAQLLPILDAMRPPFDLAPLFIDTSRNLTINNDQPATVDQVSSMLKKRSEMLTKFHHDLHKAWDIETNQTTAAQRTRTVMFESTSITILRTDPDQVEIRVKEFSIIELEEVAEGELKAASMRTIMDARPVQSRMAKLQDQ